MKHFNLNLLASREAAVKASGDGKNSKRIEIALLQLSDAQDSLQYLTIMQIQWYFYKFQV